MFNGPQGWHSDSDTVSTGSVSARPPGMFYVPQGWHSDADSSSSSSVSASPPVVFYVPQGGTTSSTSSSAWCGPAPVPAIGHQRVPNRGAVDECSDAVILADVFLVAVVDREIEASSGAAPEVEVRDGCPRIVCNFRRVSVQQLVHQLVNQVDGRRVLTSVKKLITNSIE